MPVDGCRAGALDEIGSVFAGQRQYAAHFSLAGASLFFEENQAKLFGLGPDLFSLIEKGLRHPGGIEDPVAIVHLHLPGPLVFNVTPDEGQLFRIIDLDFKIVDPDHHAAKQESRQGRVEGAAHLNAPPRDLRERISRALMEAWVWLEREGFLAPRPGQRGEWAFITRRGQRIIGHAGLEAHQKSNLLPKKLLHPILATKVWPTFIRGEYDTAVFQAFKEVEVLVRQKGGFKNEDLGVSLMRKAFHKDNGPLTDMSVPEAERESKGHLFAGAIGLYKNPSSHRNAIDSPEETVEMILLASHLLRILDRWPQL